MFGASTARVSGLDSLQINRDLECVLLPDIKKVFYHLFPNLYDTTYDCDLKLLLHSFIWFMSIYKNRPHPLMVLQNVKLELSPKTEGLYDGDNNKSSYIHNDVRENYVPRSPGNLFRIFKEFITSKSCAQNNLSDDLRLPLTERLRRQTLPPKEKILWLLLDVILPWLGKRCMIYITSLIDICTSQLQQCTFSSANERANCLKHRLICLIRVRVFFSVTSFLCSLLSFINFFMYIKYGRYRTTAERLLQLQTKHINPSSVRSFDFQFSNHSLYWNTITDIALAVLPLIDITALYRKLRILYYKICGYAHEYKDSIYSTIFSSDDLEIVPSRMEQVDECVFCFANPMTCACVAECGHTFCYVCGAERTSSNDEIVCPFCGYISRMEEIRRQL